MKYQNKLMRIAQILLTKASIPEIFVKKDFLKELADEKYYDSLDLFKLDNVKKEVAQLMKYLSGDDVFITITNFNDAIETKEREIKYNFDNFRTYWEKFIIYLHKHFGELESVKKILNLEQLNEDDLSELQDVLKKLKKPDDKSLFNNNEELIVFIRQIIGLDKKLVDKKMCKPLSFDFGSPNISKNRDLWIIFFWIEDVVIKLWYNIYNVLNFFFVNFIEKWLK